MNHKAKAGQFRRARLKNEMARKNFFRSPNNRRAEKWRNVGLKWEKVILRGNPYLTNKALRPRLIPFIVA